MRSRYIKDLRSIEQLGTEANELERVVKEYPFYANEYYLSLIDWNDPQDPIRRIIIPSSSEILPGGLFDPSNEKKFTKAKGLEHKYPPTALLLVSRACGGICRFCFRKRVFQKGNMDALPDLREAFAYIEKHKEINNVLLSGGDPLFLKTDNLKAMIDRLLEMEHIRFIRIGSKIPVYDPIRIIDDPALLELIKEINEKGRQCYIVTDINHPRELTPIAKRAIRLMRDSGASIANQTPLLRGVNDDRSVLVELFNELSSIGVIPYYVFQCRPTVGNSSFSVPVEDGYNIVEEAKGKLSGIAKRVRFIMSHSTGKLEIMLLTDQRIFFKYHNAADDFDIGRVLVFNRNRKARWLDDYGPPVRSIPLGVRERSLETEELMADMPGMANKTHTYSGT